MDVFKKISILNTTCLLLSLLATQYAFANADKPWRLDKHLNTAEWFSVSGQHRTRFENIDEQFRGNRNGGDQIVVFRTNVKTTFNFDRVSLVLEGMDSRSVLADSGTPLSTGIVNPIDILQAHFNVNLNDTFGNETTSHIKLGRFTMDVGSRRFVARNRFRNTINAFTGIDWEWKNSSNNHLRAFYTFPVQRRVSGNLLDNHEELDKQHNEVRFWGLYYSPDKLPWGGKGGVYLFGLNEEDVPGQWRTSDRNLYTPGFRIYRKPGKNEFHYQLETAFQIGESRASNTSTTDLDHVAHFHHLTLGYTFDHEWSPQLLFQYDYASGDDGATDDDNNRFNTLFGARRFEFGPTGIYGAFARSNLNSPGIRLKLKPANHVSTFIATRAYWLASTDDAWTTAGIRNGAGQSDAYIGSQIEARVRWEILPKNLRLEAGAAHLFAGDLMDTAAKNDATYLYSQMLVWF